MGSLALANKCRSVPYELLLDQSPLQSFLVFKVHDNKGNLSEERACKENDAKGPPV